METFWFVAVTLMLAIYVVLDGLDFGVGMLYPFVARTELERRTALASIKPVWTGYELWLIAAGGLLFFAFPKAYAAGFSGFYLALILVLWLLIFRGLALELRSHFEHDLWKQFWDVAFSAASLLLAVVFGAAMGNLIRGVPLNAKGYFFVALWTDFSTGPDAGILDWYTLLMGLTSVAILALHGASYLVLKTDGELARRADRVGRLAGWSVVGLTVLALIAIPSVQPTFRLNYSTYPIGHLFTITGILALAGTFIFRRQRRELAAFATSSLLIFAMLASVAWGMYPNILIATTDPANSLTITNAAAGAYGLQVGLLWFLLSFGLIIAYTVYVHRAFWGKVRLEPESQ